MTAYKLFIKISQFSVLIPLITGLRYYRKLNGGFKVFVWYFGFALGMELLSMLANELFCNNLFLMYFLVPYEFMFFAYVFCFPNNGLFKKVATTAGGILGIALIADLSIYGFLGAPSVSRSIESALLILLALRYFYFYFKGNSIAPVYRQPLFWFSSGVLVYFGIDFFTFMMSNVLLENNESVARMAKVLHGVLNIVSYIFFMVSFQWSRKQAD